VDCTLNRNLLEGYLDGELGFERALEVEAHLASCPACTSEVESWKPIRSALEQSDLYYRAPAALEAKILKLAPPREEKRGRALSWMERWLWAGGGAASATAAVLLAFLVAQTQMARNVEDRELAASHVRSMMSDHLMDVVSTNQHTVKPWFDGKIEFAPPVTDFAAEGYPLAGGRLDYLENRKVAVLIYHRALHVINLYVWPAADTREAPIRSTTVHGYNELAWKKNGFEFRAVSDLNTAELLDFAHLVSP
jgi:anti-sigma factor RsiW